MTDLDAMPAPSLTFSVRGLGCDELAEAYRAHRRASGQRIVTIGEVAESRVWRYG